MAKSHKKKAPAKKPATKPVSKPTKAAAPEAAPKETPPERTKLGKGGQQMVNIPIEKIKVKAGFNPRQALGDITGLKQQIQENGVLSPIVLCPISEGSDEYYVVAGHRRHQAAIDLKFNVIPATIRTDITIDHPDALKMAMSENDENGRSNLSPIDHAMGIKRLVDLNPKMSYRELGRSIKVSDATINRAMKLLDAPQGIRDMVEAGTLAKGTAVAVVEVDPAIREHVAAQVRPNHTEGDVRRLANEMARQAEEERKQRAAKGEPAKKDEEKPVASRPSSRLSETALQNRAERSKSRGVTQGGQTWRAPKEMKAQLQLTGTLVLNCRDTEGKTVPAQELEHTIQINRYAALLWANGNLNEIDPADPVVETTLADIADKAEEASEAPQRPTTAKESKKDAKPAPKGKDKAPSKDKQKAETKPSTKPKSKADAKPAKEPKADKAAEAKAGKTDEPRKSASEALGSPEDE